MRRRMKVVNPETIRNEEMEDNDIMQIANSCSHELNQPPVEKEVRRAISITPIVFSDEIDGCIINHTPLDIPLNFFASANLDMLKEGYLDKLSKASLRKLNITNMGLTDKLISDFIIQNAFVNVCNVIDHSELVKKGYNEFFNIKQFIYDELNNLSPYIKNIINDTSHQYPKDNDCYSALSYVPNDMDATEQNMENTFNFMYIACSQISTYVINAICMGIDKAINDATLDVHIIPNIDKLFDKLYCDKEFTSAKSINRYNVNTYASIYLKSLLNNDIEKLATIIFEVNYDILLSYMPCTSYFVINDCITMREEDDYNKSRKNGSIEF